jgi:hypothetical protein
MKKALCFILLYILFFSSLCVAQTTNIIKLEGNVRVTKDNVSSSLVDLDTEFTNDDWIYTGFFSQIIFEFNNTIIKVNSFGKVKVSEIIEQTKKEELALAEKSKKAEKTPIPEPKVFLSSAETTSNENIVVIKKAEKTPIPEPKVFLSSAETTSNENIVVIKKADGFNSTPLPEKKNSDYFKPYMPIALITEDKNANYI